MKKLRFVFLWLFILCGCMTADTSSRSAEEWNASMQEKLDARFPQSQEEQNAFDSTVGSIKGTVDY